MNTGSLRKRVHFLLVVNSTIKGSSSQVCYSRVFKGVIVIVLLAA